MSTIIDPKHARPTRPSKTAPTPPPVTIPAPSAEATRRPLPWRMLLVAGLILSAVVLCGYSVSILVGGGISSDLPLVYYTVVKRDLEIIVTERGNLESQENVKVLCQVDDIRGDNIEGTPIRWIIANGSLVEKDALLVELDGASHIERLDLQILQVEEQNSAKIQSRAAYEDQISQNKKAIADAELAVKLAELELEMFHDEEHGTHQLEVEEIERKIDDVNNEILAAQASLKLKRNEKEGVESLFKLGYAGKSELDRTRLEFLQAESGYAAKLNLLETQIATLAKKEHYEKRKQVLTLEGDLATAQRDLEKTTVSNASLLAQTEAQMKADDRAYEKENEMLQRYRDQLEKCKIYAPQAGMVAYAVSHGWRDEAIAEGAPVRERQHIISLPDLNQMQVKTAVHESVLDTIQPKLKTTVRIDAFPDRQYEGSVKSVAVLPEQQGWMSSDTKAYETVVTIDESVQQLKPGMTAVVEIHVDHLSQVICIPVQAIVQIKRDSWCYVENAGKIEKRLLTLGKTNDKFIEILAGLAKGDQVVLNPMAIIQHEKSSDETDDSPDEDQSTGETENKAVTDAETPEKSPSDQDPQRTETELPENDHPSPGTAAKPSTPPRAS